VNSRNPHALRQVVAHLCAIAVAGVFFYAAYEKIKWPGQFAIAIKNYHMVPDLYLNLMALVMPWWEVAAAIALIFPRTRRAGAILILGMLTMFIVAVSYAAFYKGYNINCGCFGKDSATAGWRTIGLDVLLSACTLASVYLCRWKRPAAAGFEVVTDA